MTRLPIVPLKTATAIKRPVARPASVLAPPSAAGRASKVLASAQAPAQLSLPLWGPLPALR